MNEDRNDDENEDESSWQSRDSGPVRLPPARRRSRVSQLDTGSRSRAEVRVDIEAASVPSMVTIEDLARESQQLLGLPPVDEEATLDFCLSRIGAVLGGRRLVVRMSGRGRGQPDLVRSTSAIMPERRDEQQVTRSALEFAGIDQSAAAAAGVEVIVDYQHNFQVGCAGFDIALTDGHQLLGVMGVEYHPGVAAPSDDAAMLQLLGAHLSMALGRARLREEARYLNGYLASLLEDANVPLSVVDRAQRVQVVSQAFLELVGKERSAVLGTLLTDSLSPASHGDFGQAVLRCLRTANVESVDVELAAANDRSVLATMELASIVGPGEDVEALLVITRDLTQLRRLEEQVVQAEKLATLGQLAAGVVHELNNPLTSISVYAERLHASARANPNADPTDVERLGRIVQAAERILRFTGDLVTYARPATEPPRSLVLREVVEQAVVFCEHVVREVDATVSVEIAADLPHVLGVRGQLHQVFINLITNACHAMPEGAGRLQIIGHRENGRTVVVRVSDNGSGVPPDQCDTIFEPFFSTKGEGRGTGLGLSIVRNILRQHGGAISIDSTLGKGATFRVALPVAG